MRLKLLPLLALVLLPLGFSQPAQTNSLPATWTPRGLGGGGGMFSPSLSPHDPNVMFLSIDMGHVFRSLDAGTTWRILPFSSLQGQQHTQVQFTSIPTTLYAAERGRDPLTEGNLFRPRKSQDLGDTWNSFTSWPPTNYSPSYANERCVTVWADPTRADSFLVASEARLWFYRASDTLGSFTPLCTFPSGNARVGGVYWRPNTTEVWVGTSDGLYYHANPAAGGAFSLVTSPPAGDRIVSFSGASTGGVLRFYAVTTQLSVTATKTPQSFSAGANNRVYRIDWLTDSAWTQETGLPSADYPIEVGLARDRIDRVHVSVARSASYPHQHGVYRQDGPGTAWTRTFLSEANTNLTTGWASLNSNSGPTAQTLETSITYASPCGFAVSPTDADRVVITDNCVIHRSDNATQASPTWRQLYTTDDNAQHAPGQRFPHGQSYATNGLELTVSYWVDWASATDVALGALDYLSPHSTDGGARWGFDYDPTVFPSGDIPQVVTDSVTGTRYAICSFAMTLYEYLGTDDVNVDYTGPGTKGAPGLWSRASGSSSWTPVRQDFGVGEPGSPLTRGANPTWVAVDATRRRLYVAVSHSNPAVDGVYLQNITTGIWQKLPSPTPGVFRSTAPAILHPFNLRLLANGDLLASYAARQVGNPNAGYAPSSGVFTYSHTTNTWTDKTTRLELRYATRDVVLDPHDPTERTWYACVTNTDLALTSPTSSDSPQTYGGLYKTVDAGDTWTLLWNGETNIAGKPGTPGQLGVTGCSVNSVTPHPTKSYELWFTTRYNGLWVSQDAHLASPTFTQTTYPFRHPQRVFFNPYDTDEAWITSNGYGVNIARRPSTFGLWQKDSFGTSAPNPVVIALDADPDADGVPNLLEYLLATDPQNPASLYTPTTSTLQVNSAVYLALTFRRRISSVGITHAVQAGGDLADWSEDTVLASTPIDHGDGTQTVTYRDLVPLNAAPTRFLRLQVTLP